jgi:WD repeat-containing protein 45
MLYKCNLLALAGGGRYTLYALTKVMIWDDLSGKVLTEMSFKKHVKGIRLR